MGDLSGLFAPERVAVVGATERAGSIGRALTENLRADFDGDVVPVNPNYETVLGLPCVPDLESTENVDLAVVAVPPARVIEVVRSAGESAISNLIVVTAGFGETGSEGVKLERELVELAERYGLAIVGPNSLGVMSTPVGLNATFGPQNARPGSISLLSQSGAFVTAVLDWATDLGIGFRDVVSLGNKTVLDETDFIRTWGDDPGTDVIAGYLESIEDGTAFVRAAREVTAETPIVLVKSGRTDAGAKAASSHTGAIAGTDRAYEAGLAQAGVIRVETVEALFDVARLLAGQPLPDADGVAVVTNAGGPGVLATDAVGESALSLAAFDRRTTDSLRESLPATANVYNPVDVIGDADVGRFESAVDLALGDDSVGMGVVIAAPTAVIDFGVLADSLVRMQQVHEKPVVACLMGGERTRRASQRLGEAGIPTYFDPARAVRSLDALRTYREITERSYEEPTTFSVDRSRARSILESVSEREESRLGVEAMGLLEAYGIPTPAAEIVDDRVEAVRAAREIEGDVVMKLVSPDILHKSDIGGVKVGVSTDDVADAYEDLLARAHSYQPDATVLGVQIQELVSFESATETIVGMNRDPQFGPLLAFGLGGIFVEVLEDVTFRLAPVGESAARTMLDDLQSVPLLRGARGREAADEDALIETIQRISQLVTEFPAILELDVNPLIASPDGVVAVDVRLTVDEDQL